ncbi:RpiB/LacA/LacB family sugar-phosphate isomerase [Alphaproteobacteria bacterium]|nr:RpiB/LacA/LacB family sugar-phosphate isomerase [Alphaproteobacteria bacterium]
MDHAVSLGHEIVDLGPDGTASVDYPDFGNKLADALATDPSAQGVAVCGTGIGISIALNRHSHIRAALVQDVTTATLTRLHNDANVIAFGDRVIGVETAKDALTAFLTTAFEGGRHQRRVEKLTPAN